MKPTLSFDLLQMSAEPAKNLLSLSILKFLPKFVKGKMNDIVVMNLLRRNIVTQFKPNAMEQVDFFWRQAWSVRPQIENVLLACGE